MCRNPLLPLLGTSPLELCTASRKAHVFKHSRQIRLVAVSVARPVLYLKVLMLGATIAFTSGSHAGEAMAAFGQSTSRAYNECNFLMGASFIFGDEEHYAGTKACVERKTADARTAYPAALNEAGAAGSRFKDYYAAWIAGMQALSRLQYGTKGAADRASSETRTRLLEMWTRIEIE